MGYAVGIANRLGNRGNNQDRCSAVRRGDTALLLLADGMGGHARGELAAQVFVDVATEAFDHAALPIADPPAFLTETLRLAHARIARAGREQDPPVYPRTTAVACLLQGGRAWWIHAGDSRLYWLRDGQVLERTRDHTLVEDLYRQGRISEPEMLSHPMRNYVTHCLGGPHEAPPATTGGPVALRDGDTILLCSDGLWGVLPEQAIVDGLAADIQPAADALAAAADQAGYPNSDNITVLAVRVLSAEDRTDVDPRGPARAAANDGGDQLTHAIESIRDAIREYGRELDKD
jgi:serine/threonine protein phosphatase PrpC